MQRLLKVQCGNPHFNGKMHGVQFEPQAGGAVGMAPPAVAAKIAKEKNFSCPDLDAAPPEPTFAAISGIGPKTAEKLEGAGVTSLDELVAADVAAIAEATGEKEEKVSDWQAQAAELLKESA